MRCRRRRTVAGLLVWFALGSVGVGETVYETDHVSDWLPQHLEAYESLYRHFHANPELSFAEEKTAQRFAQELRGAGFAVTEGVGGHGVVGVLSRGEGATLLLRADLDGLPITEATNLAYASRATSTDENGTVVGLMHACGHDLHMTNVLATAAYLASATDAWAGTLVVIGQPAEERGSGAKAMLEDGLFSRFPKPDFALALHMAPELPAGCVAYRAGYALANVDSVDITVRGRGGHGAYPNKTVDPVVQAAELVMALQTIVSREVDPTRSAVITVGAIHGGTKHNVIGDSCHLQLTVRSYEEEVRRHLLAAIRRKAEGVAQACAAPPPEITVSEGTPSLANDPDLVAQVVPAFQKALGKDRVLPAPQVMGGEDFSQYGRAGVPIFMYWLGAVEAKRLERMQSLGKTPPSLHSSEFYPDVRPALTAGVTSMTAAALELLGRSPS